MTIIQHLRRRLRQCCVLIGIGLLLNQSFCTVLGDEMMATDIKRDAPKGWMAYLRSIESLAFEAKIHHVRIADGKTYRNQVQVLTQRPGSRLNLGHVTAYRGNNEQIKTNPGFAVCINPEYAFELVRKTESSPWALTRCASSNDKLQHDSIKHRVESGWLTLKMPVAMDYNLELGALFQCPTFRVTECKKCTFAGENGVIVVFENPTSPATVDENRFPIVSGRLVLLPDRNWCVGEYEVRSSAPGQDVALSGKVEYDSNCFGLNLPKRVTSRSEFLNATSTEAKLTNLTQEYEYKFPETPPDAAQFRLAHFGLAEPSGIQRAHAVTWSPWAIWSSLATLLCIACLFAFRAWTRRHE